MVNLERKQKTVGHERPKYKPLIEKVVSHYELTDNAFSKDIENAVRNTAIILKRHKMDPDFFDAPGGAERGLIALSVADNLTLTNDPTSRKNLDYVIGVIARGVREDGELVSYSDKIRCAAEKGNVYAQYLDPQMETRTEKPAPKLTHEQIITDFLDREKTEEVRAASLNWGPDSVLHSVRNNLQITQETEAPYEIFVVQDKIKDVIPNAGAYCRLISPAEIVLPNSMGSENVTNELNLMEYEHLEHEYAHAMSGIGIMTGLYGDLFVGINEAMTEANVERPSSYIAQRSVLHFISKFVPGFPELSNALYMGDIDAKKNLFSKLINNAGSDVFLATARLEGVREKSHDPIVNAISAKVSLPPFDILDKVFQRLGTKMPPVYYFSAHRKE